MKELIAVVIVGLAWSGAAKANVARPTIEPVVPTCECREDPLAVDVDKPRLNWPFQARIAARTRIRRAASGRPHH